MSEFPWFTEVSGRTLEQGDLLFNCPVVLATDIAPESLALIQKGEQIEQDVQVSTADVVVITQSCDLEHEKTQDVALCAVSKVNQDVGKGQLKQIRKGYIPQYHLLNESPDHNLPLMVVHFHPIYSMPKKTIQDFAENMGRRLRIQPPYREHLAQAFARYFMRVGLPTDIADTVIEKHATHKENG